MSTPPQDGFDPTRYLQKLNGKDYLQVMHRLIWFRSVYPNGSISTEMMTAPYETQECLFKATVRWTNANGQQGEATGWGSETPQDFKDFREKAETKALGRALAHAGFGTQFAGEIEYESVSGFTRIADSPVPAPPVKLVTQNRQLDVGIAKHEMETATTERELRAIWQKVVDQGLANDDDLYNTVVERQAALAGT